MVETRPWLFAVALDAPIVGALVRWPKRLHAVDMEHVIEGWERATFVSACGMRGLRLEGARMDDRVFAVRWPPRLKGMPKDRERCRECWETTGRMRPRVEWKQT